MCIRDRLILLSDLSLARGLPATHSHRLIARSMSASPDVEVPRLDGQIVAAQLEAAGREHDEANRLGPLARRSLLALRRTLAHHPEILTPWWAEAADSVLRRLLLIGSWASANVSDQASAAECVGVSYEAIEERASQLAASADMPFTSRVGDTWHVVALEDAWTLLARSLTSEDLERFKKAAVEVLSEIDPALELPPTERWRSGLTDLRRCLLYTSDAADDLTRVDLGGGRI